MSKSKAGKPLNEAEAAMALGLRPEEAQAAGLSFADVLSMIRQLLALGAQYPMLLSSLRSLFTAISARDGRAAVKIVLELLAILFPEAPPNPADGDLSDPFG